MFLMTSFIMLFRTFLIYFRIITSILIIIVVHFTNTVSRLRFNIIELCMDIRSIMI